MIIHDYFGTWERDGKLSAIIFEDDSTSMAATIKAALQKRVSLAGANFVYNEIRYIEVLQGCFSRAHFDHGDLTGSTFFQCDFTAACFRNTNFGTAVFRACNFARADFRGAAIEAAIFSDCIFAETINPPTNRKEN